MDHREGLLAMPIEAGRRVRRYHISQRAATLWRFRRNRAYAGARRERSEGCGDNDIPHVFSLLVCVS
jgi:hypothetical protein